MRVIVAGCRHIDDYWVVDKAIKDSGFLENGIDEIVLGGCRGIDKAAEHWAHNHKIDLPIGHMPQPLPCIRLPCRRLAGRTNHRHVLSLQRGHYLLADGEGIRENHRVRGHD